MTTPELQPAEAKPTRRPYQFSIRSLFLAILFVAGFFAGYRTGFQRGRSAGEAHREKNVPYAVNYPVSDLLLNAPGFLKKSEDYDGLMDSIQVCVAPGTWECNGGTGKCVPCESDKSLRIVQTQEVHAMVRDFLQALRKRQIEWIAGRRPPNLTPIPSYDVDSPSPTALAR